MHLNIGVSRALINIRDQQDSGQKKMETKNFGQEVLFHLSNSNSMDTCFDLFGAKGVRSGFFLILLNMSEDQEKTLKLQLTSDFSEISLTDHQKFQDITGIINHFKIEEAEMQ